MIVCKKGRSAPPLTVRKRIRGFREGSGIIETLIHGIKTTISFTHKVVGHHTTQQNNPNFTEKTQKDNKSGITSLTFAYTILICTYAKFSNFLNMKKNLGSWNLLGHAFFEHQK